MRICLISLGCPKNTVDSEVMAGSLERARHHVVSQPEDADVVVVNTCGFIQLAKEESLDTLLEVVRLKQHHPRLKIVAAGCLAQRYREELSLEIPELDALIGVNEIPRIAAVINNLSRPSVPVDEVTVEPPGLYLYDHATPRHLLTPAHYAYIKVAEGCSRGCTFCVIPKIRGPMRSRLPEDIQAEVAQLIGSGVREIILIGQDTTAYGHDLVRPTAIAELLARLTEVAGSAWLRLMYTYPSEVDDALLETMARYPSICAYLDIPFQHSHPEVLRWMGRGGNGEQFLRLLERVRAMVPGLAVRTSLITGFPGENECHFRHLLDFIRAARFDHLGVFAYSDEEGTLAFTLPDKVAPTVAERRRDRLMQAQKKILRSSMTKWVGREVVALVDSLGDETAPLVQARTAWQAPEIDGVLYLTDGPLDEVRVGDLVRVRLTRYLDYDFSAEVLPSKE